MKFITEITDLAHFLTKKKKEKCRFESRNLKAEVKIKVIL